MKAILIKLINTTQERAGGMSEPGMRLSWTEQAGAEIGAAKANAELYPHVGDLALLSDNLHVSHPPPFFFLKKKIQ